MSIYHAPVTDWVFSKTVSNKLYIAQVLFLRFAIYVASDCVNRKNQEHGRLPISDIYSSIIFVRRYPRSTSSQFGDLANNVDMNIVLIIIDVRYTTGNYNHSPQSGRAVRKVWQIYSSAPHKLGAGLVQVIHPALERDACSAVRHEARLSVVWRLLGRRAQSPAQQPRPWKMVRPVSSSQIFFPFPRSQITIARDYSPFPSPRVAQEDRQQATVRIGDLRSVRSVNWGIQHPNNHSELARRSHHLTTSPYLSPIKLPAHSPRKAASSWAGATSAS